MASVQGRLSKFHLERELSSGAFVPYERFNTCSILLRFF